MRTLCIAIIVLCIGCTTVWGQEELSLDPLGFFQHRIALQYEHYFHNGNSISFYAPFLECDNTIGAGLGCQYKINLALLTPTIDSVLQKIRLGVGGHVSVQNEICGIYGCFSAGYKWYFNQDNFSWLGSKVFIEPKVEVLFGSDTHIFIGVNIGSVLSKYINPKELLPCK